MNVQKNSAANSKRDISVELARLIACWIVIGVHIALPTTIDSNWDVSRTFIAMIVADGVAIFWLISGAFMFRAHVKYKALLKRIFFSLIIPMIVWSAFWFYFKGFFVDGVPIGVSVSHTFQDYKDIVASALRWRNAVDGCGHLWYLYIYALVILSFPILNSFVQYLDADPKKERTFLIIAAILLILNDLTRNGLFSFSHESINGLIPASFIVILGHILYKNRKIFQKRKYIIICIVAFFGINIIRTVIQLLRISHGRGGNSIMFWYSTPGIICAVAVMAFCFSAFSSKKNNGRWIAYMASHTFIIYIIHQSIVSILKRYGVQTFLQQKFCAFQSRIGGDILYSLCMVISVFTISLGIAIILKNLKKVMKRIIVSVKK